MRNALNGLVVNLEVVRAMNAASGVSAEPFMSQAVAQAEESVRLAESTIALLGLVVGAIGPDAAVLCESLDRNDLSIEAGDGAERISTALQPLAARGVLSAETSGSAVILRIAEDRPELTGNE